MPKALDSDDIAWIRVYADSVAQSFSKKFALFGGRFSQGDQLVDRFQVAIARVLDRGRTHFRAVEEAHNELCIALALLEDATLKFQSLAYEPTLPNSEKSVDFLAIANDGTVVFVDVKTIKPVSKDRWDQYERAVREGWIAKNVAFVLRKNWLGGELWHYAFAARSRMLQYALEFEAKIEAAGLCEPGRITVLALCGEGFYWHEDELEDFVAFYRNGGHRSDDPFAPAERKYMEDEGIVVSRTINRFACMRRPQGDVLHKRLNWNVSPPIDPAFLLHGSDHATQ